MARAAGQQRSDGANELLVDARLAILADYLERRARRPENRDKAYRRGMLAMRLAPDLDTYLALMHGEPVLDRRLDQSKLDQLRREGVLP